MKIDLFPDCPKHPDSKGYQLSADGQLFCSDCWVEYWEQRDRAAGALLEIENQKLRQLIQLREQEMQALYRERDQLRHDIIVGDPQQMAEKQCAKLQQELDRTKADYQKVYEVLKELTLHAQGDWFFRNPGKVPIVLGDELARKVADALGVPWHTLPEPW